MNINKNLIIGIYTIYLEGDKNVSYRLSKINYDVPLMKYYLTNLTFYSHDLPRLRMLKIHHSNKKDHLINIIKKNKYADITKNEKIQNFWVRNHNLEIWDYYNIEKSCITSKCDNIKKLLLTTINVLNQHFSPLYKVNEIDIYKLFDHCAIPNRFIINSDLNSENIEEIYQKYYYNNRTKSSRKI